MKRTVTMLIIAAMLLSLAACGTSTPPESSGEEQAAPAATPSEVETEPEPSEAEPETTGDTIDMLYYKNMGDGDILAACYTEDGIARLGEDCYVIHTGEAEIYNAGGEKITLEELVRGCPIRISWPGMVTMSLPGQISAERIDAISDEADPSVPPEDEISLPGIGTIWANWEVPTGPPELIVGYRNELAAASVFIPCHSGSWNWSEDNGSEITAGGSAPLLGDLPPTAWNYDDNNTIQRDGFDTVTLDFSPHEPDTVTVAAYAYDGAEADVELVEVELVDGVLTLLEGDHIYVVNAGWRGEEYYGDATYGFLVTEN